MIGHKRNPHILKRLLAMMLMLALLPGAVLAESEQPPEPIPDSIRKDALEAAQKATCVFSALPAPMNAISPWKKD